MPWFVFVLRLDILAFAGLVQLTSSALSKVQVGHDHLDVDDVITFSRHTISYDLHRS